MRQLGLWCVWLHATQGVLLFYSCCSSSSVAQSTWNLDNCGWEPSNLLRVIPLSISESMLFSHYACNTNFKDSIAGTLCCFPLPLVFEHISHWCTNIGHCSHVIWSWQTTRYIHKSFKWLRKAHLKLSTDILITAVQQHKAIHAIWLTYHCLKTIKITDSRTEIQ